MRLRVLRITGLWAILVFLLPSSIASRGQTGEGAKSGAPASTTPRTSGGAPDLSGYWGRLIGDGVKTLDAGASDIHTGGGGNGSAKSFADWLTHFETDIQLSIRAQTNRPVYKTQYWAKIRKIDWDNSRANDPQSNCRPSVPRLGIPQKIVETPTEVILFYESLNRYRIIPVDGRTHDPVKVTNPAWFGDSIGHWDGDTLVIETVGLEDESWLGPTGYIHGDDTRVTERVSRSGDVLHWDTTVEDSMLLQPWHMNPLTAKLNQNQKATLWEELPCEERDKGLLVDKNQGR